MNRALTKDLSRKNFLSFIWHGVFLSLSSNFMDVDTILSTTLIKAGGNSILLGLLTAILLGGSGMMQIVFAGFLSNKRFKKHSLLLGINLRVIALLFLSILLLRSQTISNFLLIFLIFIFVSIFSFSGSYAGVSYVDIIGKSILPEKRKKFFSLKQTINGIGFLISALLVRYLIKLYDYPINYTVLFWGASVLLFTASFGFWHISEIKSPIRKKRGFLEFMRLIPSHIKKDRNLKYYLLIINSLGLGISIMPFYILFAKDNFDLSYKLIGNILLFKTSGMAISSFVLYRLADKIEYKIMLFFAFFLALLIPLLIILSSGNILFYQMIFILSGVFITLFRISISGILMEISTNENRPAYSGISGAGRILPTIFPLVFGFVISFVGYKLSFLLVVLIIFSSFFFIRKLDCKKK